MTKGTKIGQGGIDLSRNTSIKYLKITGQQIFHYSDNSYKTTPKPETITLKATLYNINLLGNNKIRWYYATGEDEWAEFPETNSRMATNTSEFTIPHDHECWEEATTLTIKAEVEYLGKIYNDEFTLAKLAQGSDAYTVLLKDESQVFPTDDRGNYDVNELRALCATELYVYKGITPLKYETQFTVSQTSASSDALAVDIEGEYHGSSVRIVPKELRADKCSAQLMITIDDKLNPSTEATRTRLTKSMSITKGKAGRDGESAQVIKITGDNIFKKENNAFTPNRITLTALLQNIGIQSRALGGGWYYSADRTTWKRCDNYEISESDSFSMINIYPNSPGFTNNLIYYKYEINENLFDLVSVGKISDGLDGVGYSVFLSNDSENIPTDSLGNVSADYLGENGKTFTEVEVYRSEGSVITQLTPTTSSSIGKNEFKLKVLNNQSPQNIAVVSSSQPNKVYLHTLSSDSKNFEIQVKLADEQTFTKVFTVVKSKQGLKGDQGLQGLQGPKGDQGIPGASGNDGRTSYFHIKYSEFENPTLPEHISDTHNKYIGTYVDFNEIDDPNPLRYTWRRFEGTQGEQGLPGLNGENGQTSYLHIKYSNDGGRTFTSNNGETVGDYIGQYTDFEEDDKLDVKLYKWSKIKGEKGDQGLPGLQGIQGPQGEQGIPGVPGADGMNSYFHIKYSPIANPVNSSDMTEEPNTYIGTYVDNIEEDSDDPRRYRWSRFEGIQGPQGEQGIPGINGEDGRTSYLHIKYSNDGGRTFTPNNGEDVGAYLGQYTDFIAEDSTDVKRYKWTKIIGETGPQGPQGPPGANGNLEDFPDTLPSKPVLTGRCIGFNSVDLSWTYENKIYYTYEVYASQTSGFTPSSSNVIFKGQGSAFLHNVSPGQTWYYKARAINTHGRATAYSDQITVRTTKIDDLSNYVNDAAIGNALIGELSFDRAWAGTLQGHYIDAKNLSVTNGNGEKTLEIDSAGNVRLNVSEFHLTASATSDVPTKTEVAEDIKTSIDNVQVGGRNLWIEQNLINAYESSGNATRSSSQHQMMSTYTDLNGAQYVTVQLWNPNSLNNTSNTNRIAFYDSNKTWISSKVTPKPNGTTYVSEIITVPTNAKYMKIGMVTGVSQHESSVKIKVELGNKPTDWSPAPEDMENAYTIILTNEAQVIPTDSSRRPTSSATYSTDIQVYKGATQRTDYTIGTINSANGITVSKTSSRVNFAVSTSTALTADGGYFIIPIAIDGKTFNKTFSWSCSKQGVKGDTGAAGGDGQDAQYVILSGDQVFKYSNNFTGAPTPENIKIQATAYGISNPRYTWEFKRSGETTWNTISSATNNNQSYYTLPHDNSTIFNSSSVKSVAIRCTVNGRSDEITVIKVSDGAKGDTGAAGNGISSITEYYAISSSNTTAPTSWSTTVPAMTATNKYLWNYETITYSNNTTANTSKRVIGVYGDKGNTGATGSTGNGISNIVNYYLATSSSSGVTTSTSGWTTSVQAVSASKKYLWNYEVITYTNGSTSTTTPCIIGAYGDTGATGPAGQNAQHVVVTGEQVFKYANNFSGTPTPANITLTATKINTTATGKWQWLNGSTWTDWSNNASTLNATTLSVSPTSGSLNTGKSIRIRYIVGSVYDEITLVKVSDGTNGTNGTNGADAYTVILTNETHTFPAQNNGNIPTALSTTTQVVAYKGASSITPTIGNLPSVSGLTLSKSGTTVTVQANTGTSLADSGSFNIPVTVDGKSFTKTFSWSKAKQGNTGATGSAGQDAITIVLSNENHTFPCESNGNIPTALSTTCVVTAYKGGTSVTPTIGTITNPTGMTITKNGATLTIQANTGTSLADSGTVNIPITVDGKTFNKTFTWSKAKKGATGATGPQGVQGNKGDKGDTGQSAKYVIVNGEQVFKYTNNFSGTPTPATITLTATKFNTSESGKWQYKDSSGTWIDWLSGGSVVTSATVRVAPTSGILGSAKQMSIRYIVGSVYDEITIVKVSDGSQGPQGSAGKDAYTVILTNESHTFPAENNGSIASDITVTTDVLSYKGASSITPTIGTLPTVNGLTLSKTNNRVTIVAKSGTALADSGSFNIPITVDGKSFTKTFSWAKSRKGNTGNTGAQGPAGQNASHVVVTGEQVFKYTNNFSGTPTPATITLTATKINTTATGKWQWLNGSTWTDWSSNTSTLNATTLSVSPTSGSLNTGKSIRIRYIVGSVYDEITIVKVSDGANGANGANGTNGTNGADAYTVILTNETHTFPTQNNGNIPTALSTTTQVMAYKGAKSVSPTIGSITNPAGMTITKNGATLTIQANTGTSLADSGTVNIPITVDGKTFNKTFSWSKAKQGNTGATGATGAGAKTADIIASSQVFKSTDGGLTFSPTTITMTPKLQNVTYSNWQYSTNGGSTWNGFTNSISGWSISSGVLTINKDCSLFTKAVTSVVFRLNTNDSSIYDTMTIVKLYDIADLEIGGRNYLQNSNFANGLDKWAVHDMSNSTGTNKSVSAVKGGDWADPNINTLQIKGTNVTGRYGVMSSNITLVANTTYAISGYCAGHRVRKLQVNVRDKQNSAANIHTVEYNPVSGGNSLSQYYKFETTFTTTSNTLFALNLYAVDLADDGYAWFANVKLEKGNKASDWSPAPEDTTATIDGLRSDVTTMISGVQDQVDGKVETFYQADDPASAWTTTALKNAHKGDIWYKTTDKMTYRYSGTGWVKLADGDAESAKTLASSKKRVFTATPTVPYEVGDLWVTALNETGDLKVCKTARTSGSYTASDWVKATDYIDSTQAGNIAQGKVDAQTQASIFNKLTNNGATQGIYLDGGKIYINGEYIKANSITADRLSISDFTNYAQLNNNTATKYGFTKQADEVGGAWLKRNSMARDIYISDYYTCNGGESFRIKYDISTTIKGNSSSGGTDSAYRGTAIGLYCYDGSGKPVGIAYSTRYTNQTVNGSSSTVKIPTTARKFRVFIQTESYGNWSGELKVRNIQVTKMASGELIVDGAITADRITSGTFKGVNFEAGGSGTAGSILSKDGNNNITFQANKNGVYATKISFPNSISGSGAIVQTGNVYADGTGFNVRSAENGTLYRTEYSTNVGLTGVSVSEQTYNTEGGGNVAGPVQTTRISGYAININGAALSNGGSNRLKVQTQYGNVNIGPYNSDWCHFDTDRGKFWFSKNVHVNGEIYAGSGYNQKVYHTGNKPTPADIGAAKALTNANGYQGFTLNDGSTSGWIRTTLSGIIPYQASNSNWNNANSSSSLGTSSWRFANGYIKEVYCNGLKNDLGDLWLSSKPNDSNATIYAQSKWLCPSSTVYTYLGSSGYRWHSVWASNGSIQTSDERFKVKQGFTDIEECYEMIKDTDIYNYIMLNQNKEDLSKNRLGKLALSNSQEQVNVHMGIMAQDIQKYKCSKQILVEGEYERADGSRDTMLSVNPYGLTTAIMGALKVEIQKRELLEDKITKLESLVEQLMTQSVK